MMTTVADYISIQDSSITMNPTGQSWPDTHSFDFDAPSANLGFRPVLMFRVNPQLGGGSYANISMFLNGEEILDQVFDTETHRSFHEIIDANILEAEGNQIVVNAHGDADEIILSDLVLLYKKNI